MKINVGNVSIDYCEYCDSYPIPGINHMCDEKWEAQIKSSSPITPKAPDNNLSSITIYFNK